LAGLWITTCIDWQNLDETITFNAMIVVIQIHGWIAMWN